MVKKEYASVWQLKMMYIFCCMVLLASVVFFVVNSVEIDNLQEEINSMPHYECTTEYQRENISFPQFMAYKYNPNLRQYKYAECLTSLGFYDGQSNISETYEIKLLENPDMAICYGYRTIEICEITKFDASRD